MKTNTVLFIFVVAFFVVAIGANFFSLTPSMYQNVSITTQETRQVNPTKTKEAIIVSSPAPLPNTPSPNPKKLLGWIPYWDQEAAYESFKTNIELFDFISFFWYRLDSNGLITTYTTTDEDQSKIDFAHENGVKVLAVIANLPDYTEGGDWDSHRVDHVIATDEARQAHIAALLKLVEEHNFDGINIDYEALHREQRNDFTLFIKELSEALHLKGKILGVALHPKTSENNPAEDNGSHAQDWEQLSKFADQLYLMTYSEHYLGSAPGPNASPGWIDHVLNYAVNAVGVPRKKIFFGIPFFGHTWSTTDSKSFTGISDDVTFQDVLLMQQKYDIQPQWDSATFTPYLTYTDNDREIVTWFENAESLKEKLALREKYAIPNLAFWRLNGEDPKIWPLLQMLKN